MLRSFHYAALAATLDHERASALSPSVVEALGSWARLWQVWVSWAFLRHYLNTAGNAEFVPRHREELRVLLDAMLLDKAIYELGYELNNRPDWLQIPLLAIGQILGAGV
jgi:maltose alpha-D-glucosyltransferase / alpha-amylase